MKEKNLLKENIINKLISDKKGDNEYNWAKM